MKTIRLFSICLIQIPIVLLLSGCRKDTHSLVPGESANDFLSARTYNRLVVEIQYVSGYQPSASTVNNITAFLQNRLNKPGGISVVQEQIGSPGKSVYSIQDVETIENANRTQKTQGQTIAAYFLFLDGDYYQNSSNSKILGVTYSGTSVVIFENTIRQYSGGLTQPPASVLESTVSEHQFGHLMGLVNNGTPMQSNHQDVSNGKHCTNQNCLMYFNVETSNVIGNLTGGNIPDLDVNCLSDLRGNGGK